MIEVMPTGCGRLQILSHVCEVPEPQAARLHPRFVLSKDPLETHIMVGNRQKVTQPAFPVATHTLLSCWRADLELSARETQGFRMSSQNKTIRNHIWCYVVISCKVS